MPPPPDTEETLLDARYNLRLFALFRHRIFFICPLFFSREQKKTSHIHTTEKTHVGSNFDVRSRSSMYKSCKSDAGEERRQTDGSTEQLHDLVIFRFVIKYEQIELQSRTEEEEEEKRRSMLKL